MPKRSLLPVWEWACSVGHARQAVVHVIGGFGAGYLTTFSTQSWKAGYGGWSLYFAPEIVQAVVEFAAQLGTAADPNEGYREMGRLLRRLETHEPDQFVFPDAVDRASGKFRESDSPPIRVQVSSGWVVCPYCDMRFSVTDPRRWDGKRHATCGQRLIASSPPSPA